ncbi:MAG: hypothetical protein NTZ59_03900 [Bacteroidetes bacterium]|nr:hypothetical protein [Bacteroidota bacterium]
MKSILTIPLLFTHLLCLSQQKDSLNSSATFITTFNIDKSAGKGEVYYLNGYVVHINRRKALKFDDKTVEISGEVTLVKVKGLSKQQAKRMQGQVEDSKHIFKPKIRIVSANEE